MKHTLTVACIGFKSLWQAACRLFLIHLLRRYSLRSGFPQLALAALLLAPLAALYAVPPPESHIVIASDARAGIMTPRGEGRRGWPEGLGYLTSQPQIQLLQMIDVVADGLAFVLDHQAGAIESLDLRELVISATTKAVRQTGEAKIANPYGASVK